jgi:CRISPR-associated protein Cmr2
VQAFIAQARRTQDLYVGSRILSQLASTGVRAAYEFEKTTFQAIYPVFINKAEERLPNSVAHKFAFIQTGNPHDLAQSVKAEIEDKWKIHYTELVSNLIVDATKRDDWEKSYNEQIEDWLEMFWVAVPFPPESAYPKKFAEANRALAARKLTRTFPQVYQPGRKCTLTGMQSALFTDDKILDQLRKKVKDDLQEPRIIRRNEYMGAIALIKRFAQFTACDLGKDEEGKPVDVERFASTNEIAGIPEREADTAKGKAGKRQEGYFAVLHMDGDRMGKLLSQLDSQDKHQGFSSRLAHFAETIVPSIIDEINLKIAEKQEKGKAQLVYAGGDDVLALLPIHRVLECAYLIQQKYAKTLQGYQYEETSHDGKKIINIPTMSAGIAITPYDLPLDNALELAREAETTAKEQYGRNAIVVVEAHGTGMQRPAGAKWDIIPLFNALVELFNQQLLSSKLGYDLQSLAHDMGGDVPPEARQAEARRLIRRRKDERINDDKVRIAWKAIYDGTLSLQAIEDELVKKFLEIIQPIRSGLMQDVEKIEDTNKKSFEKKRLQEISPLDLIADEISKLAEKPNMNWNDMANWVILARFLGQSNRNEQEIATS